MWEWKLNDSGTGSGGSSLAGILAKDTGECMSL